MYDPALILTLSSVIEKNANRMEVLSIKDLREDFATRAIQRARRQIWGETMSKEDAKEIYDLIGGRLSVLMALAKRKDMLASANDRVEQEKQWLLSKIGLIPDHDDGEPKHACKYS